MVLSPPILAALGSALLFGASVPLAKSLAGALSPFLLAGFLYLGSGLGLLVARTVRDRGFVRPDMVAGGWAWLALSVLVGGVAGPVLLMVGLAHASATAASLLLNIETAFTALFAWALFGEHVGRRNVGGLALILAGGLVLALPSGCAVDPPGATGTAGVLGACACWALDNNIARKVAGTDALFLSCVRGLVAGAVNLGIALLLGAEMPGARVAAAAAVIGVAGYGASLALFLVALRGLGAARTGAYFAAAPFVGALVSVAWLREPTSLPFWIATALFLAGVRLYLTERHEHEHEHEPMEHSHAHRHDEHHRHEHDFEWDGREPHTHVHRHQALVHSHPHFPDLHHRHGHRAGTTSSAGSEAGAPAHE